MCIDFVFVCVSVRVCVSKSVKTKCDLHKKMKYTVSNRLTLISAAITAILRSASA